MAKVTEFKIYRHTAQEVHFFLQLHLKNAMKITEVILTIIISESFTCFLQIIYTSLKTYTT